MLTAKSNLFSIMLTKALDQNPLDLAKSLAILAMVIIHCRFFYSLHYNFQSVLSSKPGLFFVLMTLTGILSLSIAIMAGQELFERLRSFIVGGKLQSLPYNDYYSLLLLFAFLDPIKTALSEGLIHAFHWNALPLICSSIALILVMAQRCKIKWIPIFLVLFWQAASFLEPMLRSVAVLSPAEVLKFHFSTASYMSLIALLFFLTVIFDFLFLKKISNLFFRVGAIIIFLLVLFLIFENWKMSPTFSAAVYNLPIFSVVHLEGNIWSFFPWSFLVFFGFYFQWLQAIAQKKIQMHLLYIILSLFILILSFESFYAAYYKLLDGKSGFSTSIFSLDAGHFPVVWALYVMLYYMLKLLANDFILKNRICKFLSSGIIVIYLTHYLLAVYLAPVFSRLIGGLYGYWAYLSTVLIFSLGFSALIIYLYTSKLNITLSKHNAK